MDKDRQSLTGCLDQNPAFFVSFSQFDAVQELRSAKTMALFMINSIKSIVFKPGAMAR